MLLISVRCVSAPMSMSNWPDSGTVIYVHMHLIIVMACLANYSFYLFNNYNTITNYIVIIYELNNFNHVFGVVSQTRVSGGNRIHDPHANSLAQYPLD